MVGLVATDPWSRHDGYALGCHSDRNACMTQADRLAAAMRAHFPGERVLAIEVRADAMVWACFTWSRPGGSPVCRLGPDDGWPTTLPLGTF
jgi:hypothetical protein